MFSMPFYFPLREREKKKEKKRKEKKKNRRLWIISNK